MKEEKICTFTKPGYRLQLLKITNPQEISYYQIRKNRLIVATATTIEFAYKRFTSIVYQVTMQKQINFGEAEPIQAPDTESIKNLAEYELYENVGGYALYGQIRNEENKEKIIKLLNLEPVKLYKGKRYRSKNFT